MKTAKLLFSFTLVFFLTVVGTPAQAQAQTKISGTLKSAKNGVPVANANIVLKHTYDGTSTDSLGRFSFSTT